MTSSEVPYARYVSMYVILRYLLSIEYSFSTSFGRLAYLIRNTVF